MRRSHHKTTIHRHHKAPVRSGVTTVQRAALPLDSLGKCWDIRVFKVREQSATWCPNQDTCACKTLDSPPNAFSRTRVRGTDSPCLLQNVQCLPCTMKSKTCPLCCQGGAALVEPCKCTDLRSTNKLSFTIPNKNVQKISNIQKNARFFS